MLLYLIIAGFVVVAGIVGYATGSLVTSLGTGRTARDYADWLIAQRGGGVQYVDSTDEESRWDALTIRDLIQAAQRISGNEDAAKALELGEYTEFTEALMAAEDRFAGWIEWAEGPTATKTALSAGADA